MLVILVHWSSFLVVAVGSFFFGLMNLMNRTGTGAFFGILHFVVLYL